MKHYPPQFKADAVALYQSRPGATIGSIADDLGINRETLRSWVRAAGASRPRGRRAEVPARAAGAAGGGERRPAPAGPRAGGGTRHPAEGGPVFRRGDALVNRFQFVADHQRTLRREAAVHDPRASPARASTTGGRPRPTGPPGTPPTPRWPRGSGRCTPTHDGTYGAPRITAELRDDGDARSTTSGSPG